MKCDSKSAIAICLNPVHHDRTKHLGINRYYIKRKIDKKIISLEYVPSVEQSVDMITEGVFGVTLRRLNSKLGIRSPHAPTWVGGGGGGRGGEGRGRGVN